MMFSLYHIICYRIIKRNNFSFNWISLQQLLDYLLVFKTFIQYCNVKALMSINNILLYELNNRINFEIKQCASLYLFSQIISSNHYCFYYLWRKHVYIIYVDLFKRCQHLSKMQIFFLLLSFRRWQLSH